jgi:hypothetical protein
MMKATMATMSSEDSVLESEFELELSAPVVLSDISWIGGLCRLLVILLATGLSYIGST